jgi:RNA polymerase sigma factor (sigma-70 family)
MDMRKKTALSHVRTRGNRLYYRKEPRLLDFEFRMRAAVSRLVLRQFQLLAGAQASGACDAVLLERFVGQRDEAAFAALAGRHGAMVWNVCRRVLRDGHEAEDVFQAAFLILAQKAGTIRRHASVASWLHGVTHRLALRVRAKAATRQARARQAPERARPESQTKDPLEELSGRELVQMLDAELQCLPERLRAPLVLCYLEGRSQGEAADQLGWSKTTLRGRLERGREMLRRRLTRRGLPLSAVLLPGVLTAGASAAPPAALAASTAHAAFISASGASAGLSPSVLLLVRAMSRTLLCVTTACRAVSKLRGRPPFACASSERLFLLEFAVLRRLGQREEHNLLAGYGADVVVHAQHLHAGNLMDHRFHDRPRRFDQVSPDLFEQVPPLLGGERLDQLLFGRRQDAL